MCEYPPYKAYLNLGAFFASRGFSEPTGLGKDRDTFITEIDHFEAIRIGAAHGQRAVVVFILSPGSQHAARSSKLRDLLAGLDSEPPAKAGKLAEVILILDKSALERRKILDVVREFRERPPERYPAPPPKNPRYCVYSYSVFTVRVPEAASTAVHRILPAKEAQRILLRMRLQVADLKTILDTDPPVVWAGGHPGQIVETKDRCETTGYVWDYWRVTLGPLGPAPM